MRLRDGAVDFGATDEPLPAGELARSSLGAIADVVEMRGGVISGLFNEP